MRWRLAACLSLLTLTTGCDFSRPGIETTPTMRAGVHVVRLTDFELPLHVVQERQGRAGRPIVLYATGDGGWRGVDREIVDTIARIGYPLAGFSAKDYLDRLDSLPETATPEHVGADYATLIDSARQAMGAPDDTSVILSGFSRGAALSVIAAGNVRLQPSLRGVLVMGLGDIEEHVQSRPGRAPAVIDLEVVKPYGYLSGLGSLPLSVIQSTRDRFLGASEARQLFGADTQRRRLHAIEAQSHTFGGARERLFREIDESLAWIETAFPAPAPSAGGR